MTTMQIQNSSLINFEIAKPTLFTFLNFLCFIPAAFLSSPVPAPQETNFSSETMLVTWSLNHWLDFYSYLKICFILSCVITLLYHLLVLLPVRYITFDTNFCCLRRLTIGSLRYLSSWISGSLFALLILENDFHVNMALLSHISYGYLPFSPSLKNCKNFRKIFPYLSYLSLAVSAVTPVAHILCLLTSYILCRHITRSIPLWVPFLLILLSNDIELNPGPQYHENFLNFMNWNLNSLAKNNFERIQLLEAHNSIYNYDLISICETNLNNKIEIPDPLLNDYSFIPANHPDNVTHGGVGLFYKNTLPLKRRRDLEFDESIVVELKFGRKKYSFPLSTGHHLSRMAQLILKNS